MKVTVYGSGSKGNAYKVECVGGTLLLDAGLNCRELRRRGCNLAEIDAALITHSHGDHAAGVGELVRRGIPCYMSESTKLAVGVNSPACQIFKTGRTFKVGESVMVRPFALEHDVPNVGFLIGDGDEQLIYITDTCACRYRFKKLNIIMVECNHSYEIVDRKVALGTFPKARADRLYKSHFALENVLVFLKQLDLSCVREIWLIHLSDTNSNEDKFKKEVERATGLPVYIAG